MVTNENESLCAERQHAIQELRKAEADLAEAEARTSCSFDMTRMRGDICSLEAIMMAAIRRLSQSPH